jgi:hypothetical protein
MFVRLSSCFPCSSFLEASYDAIVAFVDFAPFHEVAPSLRIIRSINNSNPLLKVAM